MKSCAKCHKDLPEADFGKNKSSPDGLSKWCKPCQREYNRGYRSKPDTGPEIISVDAPQLLTDKQAEKYLNETDDGKLLIDRDFLLRELVKQYFASNQSNRVRMLDLMVSVNGLDKAQPAEDDRKIVQAALESMRKKASEPAS